MNHLLNSVLKIVFHKQFLKVVNFFYKEYKELKELFWDQ